MANVLITGGSGYLGGSLLALLKAQPNLTPTSTKIYALVRSDEQAEQVKKHFNAEPITLDLKDPVAITHALRTKNITIVFYLINAIDSTVQTHMINSLSQIQRETGQQTHLLHTTGAKGFSSHTGFPTDPPLTDDDDTLVHILETSQAKIPIMQKISTTNTDIIQAAERTQGAVHAYILAPCIIYGRGLGFGNKISIQTKAIVQAARATRTVYTLAPEQDNLIWPVCHIDDISTLYAHLLNRMLAGEPIDHNDRGFYLAASGHVPWYALYTAMAKELYAQGVVDSPEVVLADRAAVKRMAEGLGVEEPMVAVGLSGQCTWISTHAKSLGWQPAFAAKHALDTAGEEVRLILEEM